MFDLTVLGLGRGFRLVVSKDIPGLVVAPDFAEDADDDAAAPATDKLLDVEAAAEPLLTDASLRLTSL